MTRENVAGSEGMMFKRRNTLKLLKYFCAKAWRGFYKISLEKRKMARDNVAGSEGVKFEH